MLIKPHPCGFSIKVDDMTEQAAGVLQEQHGIFAELVTLRAFILLNQLLPSLQERSPR